MDQSIKDLQDIDQQNKHRGSSSLSSHQEDKLARHRKDNIKTLVYSQFKRPFIKSDFSDGLKELNLGYFNHPIQPGSLPPSLEKLNLGSEFQQDILPGTIPSTCKYLHFGDKFNKSIVVNSDLYNVETIILGVSYNQPLQAHSIANCKKLVLTSFKYTIQCGALPEGLLELTLKWHQGVVESGALPKSLLYLKLPSFLLATCPNTIPDTLLHIDVTGPYSQFPLTEMVYLDFNSVFPISLISLSIPEFEMDEHGQQVLDLERLVNLEYLKCRSSILMNQTKLPNTLKCIHIVSIFPIQRPPILKTMSSSSRDILVTMSFDLPSEHLHTTNIHLPIRTLLEDNVTTIIIHFKVHGYMAVVSFQLRDFGSHYNFFFDFHRWQDDFFKRQKYDKYFFNKKYF
ncbi:hypothetical protein DFA_05234 [Cavenderia fasciculata]|uniref:Uncharacterized protein n=1 Tax=Cavenderia fasciculata TaxID=261658 RepID=F4PNQ1_CACFS|nr:uncharacterized protein DFA_05234 [Cavenderia fasciculata]EGG23104.1 hypothetical protein DFA_05234 [Cavenderia fasciculata]|eukprot:XP_004360955.1 hypothetical protein DFA_05234 [Cavenderia fasciculata]